MSQRTFRTFNPTKNTFNTHNFSVHTEEQVKVLLHNAMEAQVILDQESDEKISGFLLVIKEKLTEVFEELKIIYCQESGLGETRFKREFERTIGQLVLFSNYLKSKAYQSETVFKEEIADKIYTKKKIGIGPVLILGASNFPLAYSTIGGDSVAALASKNPIIVKAHPFHVGTSSLVAKIIDAAVLETGLPIGTFSHVIDDGFELATYLASHDAIKAIGFTGSQKGGEALLKLSGKRKSPIPVFAEMGSSNPVIILNSYLNEGDPSLAKKIAASVCTDAGQFCTKPGMLFIPKNISGIKLSEEIKEEILNFPDHPMLHPNIQTNFEKSVERIERSFGEATFSQQEDQLQGTKQIPKKSILITSIDSLSAHSFLEEEVFGPHLSIFYFREVSELTIALKQLRGQLTFSVFSSKKEPLLQSLTHIGTSLAGRVLFNDLPTGVAVCASMHHGGPYPASSDSRFTAVGTDSIKRFQRSVTIQHFRI